MTDGEWQDAPAPGGGARRPRRVRVPGFVPGFVTDEEIGLGDAVRRVTSTVGIRRPCGGCERRAAALNRRVVLSRGRAHQP
ncbi:hypothetical protein [Kitasatospora sp. NPDC056181]|uniref:hypothetical protein n=1 Tax=Kitasatospora sp. NPDC056181 TaxID=3345737 RepID=UPI0035E32055